MPETAHRLTALEGKFLGDGVVELLLQDVHVVGWQIVLVHQHTVFEILVARNR